MSTRITLAVVAVPALALIAGCASMDGLAPHSSTRDASALAAQQSLRDAHVADAAWPARDWWKALNDAQLDALIDEAVHGSPTLNIAAARARKWIVIAARWHRSSARDLAGRR